MRPFLAALFVLIAFPLGAEDQTVTLRLPADFAASACPSPVWKGTSVVWKGAVDRRESREVGAQTKKGGKDPVLVLADPPLESVLNEVVPDLLTACGLKLVAAAGAAEEMSLEIKEFHADVEKRLLTGKGSTRSDFQLVFRDKGAVSRTFNVGYEIEERKVRRRSIRQTEEALNDLLRRTLEQLPKVEGLKEL